MLRRIGTPIAAIPSWIGQSRTGLTTVVEVLEFRLLMAMLSNKHGINSLDRVR